MSVYGRDRLNAVGESGGGREGKGESGELFLYSPVKVIIFVGLMCGMLVLMYFFYNILGEWNHKTTHVSFDIIITQYFVDVFCVFILCPVYVIIVIFCLASASALFSCLDAIMEKMGCGTVRYEHHSFLYNFTHACECVIAGTMIHSLSQESF